VERGVDELLQCLAGQTAPIVSVTDYSVTVDDNGLSTSTSNFDESITTGADFGGRSQKTTSNADFGGSATILCRSNRRLSFTDIASPARPSLPLKIEQYAQVT